MQKRKTSKLLSKFGRVLWLFLAFVLLISFTHIQPARAAGEWWNTDWPYRFPITPDDNKIDANLDNFPVTVYLNSSNFDFSTISFENGQDIRFIDENGTMLAYETEQFSKTSQIGVIHVRIPKVYDVGNSPFYLYCGNPSAGDGQNPAAVWDSNFRGVWHMKDLTTSTIKDSTSNTNNGTKYAANEPIEVDGKTGKAQNFDGSNDYISVPDSDVLDFGTGGFTIELWFKADGVSGVHMLLTKLYDSTSIGRPGWRTEIGVVSAGKLDMVVYDSSDGNYSSAGATSLQAGVWYHAVFTRNSSGNQLSIYLNGSLDAGPTTVTVRDVTNDQPVRMGVVYYDSSPYYRNFFDGTIDEVRISNVERSAAWIKATYHSGNNSLLAVGEKEILFHTININSVASSASLIDRKQDFAGSGATTSTTVTATVSTLNGYGAITTVKISIRNNNDTVVVDNVAMTPGTIIDENTKEYTYVFDPDNNSSCGQYDVLIYASDNENVATRGWFSLFSVVDATSTIDIDPENPYYGWEVTVSGEVSGQGYTASADNVWLIDNVHGIFTLGAGNNWSNSYAISAAFGENVGITVKIKDINGSDIVDGMASASYVVSENTLFQIELRWEENGELITDLSGHDFRVKFWWNQDSAESSDLLPITTNPENFSYDTDGENTFLVRIYDNNPEDYWRSRVPTTQGGVLVFLIPSPDDTIYQYQFTCEDYTLQFYTGWVRFYTGEGIVNEDWWDVSRTCYAYLILHGYYSVRVFSDDMQSQYELQHFQAEMDTTPATWIINVFDVDVDIVYSHEVISVVAYRGEDGAVKVDWESDDNNTELVTIKIYDRSQNLLAETEFAYPALVSYSWTDAENTKMYWVEVETQHSTYGTWSDWFSIGSVIAPILPDSDFDIGQPIPLLSLLSVCIIFFVAVTFVSEYGHIAMFAIAGMVTLLGMLGWLEIDWGIAAFLWVVAFLFLAGRWRR